MNTPSYKEVRNYRIVILILVVVFVVYNIRVYRSTSRQSEKRMNASALRGERIFQQKNCTACHQFYGLGGYLGPDLTNVISHKNKGPEYVKAMVNSGIKQMPKYNFNEKEQADLVAFLSHIDSTGFYPNYDGEVSPYGWIKLKYK